MSEDLTIDPRAIELMLEHEGFTGRVDWPGGASGLTVGRGYDLGYHTDKEIRDDWGKRLATTAVNRLMAVAGLKGEKAAVAAVGLKDIKIPKTAADAVFHDVDVPRWIRRTAEAFPGYEDLPDAAQGALVSLVFNRGPGMGVHGKPSFEARREMRQIRYLIAGWRTSTPVERTAILAAIAGELRSMCRLWTGKMPAPYNVKMGGLLRRREDEARLVERQE